MADYDQAIKLNPKSVYAYNNRGASFQRKGDFARASADYGEVTRLQPNNPDAWSARCWVRAAGGREVQQALSDCNQALKLKADRADVLDTRGFVHLRLGKMDDAIKDYDAALKLDPKLAGALYGRGVAKMKKGDKAGGSADIAAAKAHQVGHRSRIRALRHQAVAACYPHRELDREQHRQHQHHGLASRDLAGDELASPRR